MATTFKMVTGYTGKQDRTPSDDASLNASILGKSEYVLDYGNKLSATLISANEIQLSDGIVLMQGKELRIVTGDTISATINNGETGYYRRDLIVAEYSKGSDELESCIIKTIEGIPSSTDSGAIVPSHTTGDIESGATANQMPLYVVLLNGLSVSSVTPQFAIMGLHTIAVTQTGTDLNDYIDDGKWYFNYNSHPTNSPVGAGAGGWLEVLTADGNNIKQIWHNLSDASQKTFVRVKYNNAWQSWDEIETKPKLLWENKDLSSDFTPKTIGLHLEYYKEIKIAYTYRETDSYYTSNTVIVEVGKNFQCNQQASMQYANINFATRDGNSNLYGVTFSDCYSKNILDGTYGKITNNMLIPYKIYGIK